MSLPLRPTRAEVKLSALRHNFGLVRKLAGSAKIMAVVKAEAYGHGLVRVAQEFSKIGADYLGVSFLEEGVILRETGLDIPILVMGGLVDEQIERYLDYSLDITVSSVWKARQVESLAERKGVKAAVHLKFDTGMGRVGQQWHSAELLLNATTKMSHIDLKGIYSHFASAESEDLTYAKLQLERFELILEMANRLGIEFPLIHIANSGALLQLNESTTYNMIRPGILLYGIAPSRHLEGRVELQPVMTLKSQVVYVKKPPAGTKIGYGSTWSSPGGRWIATVPIGYGDGYPRRAGNRAEVILRGRRCPVVGNVSMDQLTIDAGPEAYLGDEVLLFGKTDHYELPIWNLCEAIDAIPYEILSGLTARLPRVYVE